MFQNSTRPQHFLLGLCLLYFAATASATTNPVGGGILDAGLEGFYYANTTLAGEPLFRRRDLRLDFDWGSLRKPGGGMRGDRLNSLGADNYSVRWEGRLQARFSETYTLRVEADAVRLWIKPSSDSEWPATPLLESWPVADPVAYTPLEASFAFDAATVYDLRVEYREQSGPARMRLLWSSPSTPLEVVQPSSIIAEKPFDRNMVLADALHSASNWSEANPTDLRDGVLGLDADRWPTEDFSFLIRPQNNLVNPGTYLVSFNGWAVVSFRLTNGVQIFSADGSVLYGNNTKTVEQGYDSATNTTTVRVVVPAGNGNCWPNFANTDRDGPGAAFGTYSGLTNVRVLRPAALGGDTPHDPDELFARETLRTLETFVSFRWNDVNGNSDANGTSIGAWEHRKPWGPNPLNTSFTAENHEYKILLSNHSGRDLYIQVPHTSTDDYITQMAQLIRYGGDENGIPHTSEQADPYFPPLNPNLRVNIEYSNETPWNGAGQYPQAAWIQAQAGVLRDAWLANPASPDGLRFAILNFDNAYSTDPAVNINGLSSGKRFYALRTVEISNIFRSVFGDDAMTAPGRRDPRVRMLFMYQYDNGNGTATDFLEFVDNYWNKTSPLSPYAGTPKPVQHFIYGGGAATYYASADRLGIDTEHPLTADALGTFQTPVLGEGEAVVAPAGSPWTFSGTAGIYREALRHEGSAANIPVPTKVVDTYTYRGMKITVGPNPVAVYEVGRYVHSGNSGTHTLAIYDADAPHTSRYSFGISLANMPAGQFAWRRTGRTIFVISNKSYAYPIILQPNKSYYVVCTESNNGDAHAGETAFTPPPGISIDGSAMGQLLNGAWTWQVGSTPNRTFGPLNLRVAPLPHTTDTGLDLGFLNDSRDGIDNDGKSLDERTFSTQAAFLAGTGSMEIDVTFSEPGIYALVYNLGHKIDQQPEDGVTTTQENPLDLFLVEDGVPRRITPASQTSIYPATKAWNHEGYWVKPNTGMDFYGSAPFTIADASKTYRIRLAGSRAETSRVVLLDNIHIASSRRMTEGQIPSGGGFAEGAPDVSNWEARVMSMYKYPQSYGLKAISYEGGWYPGGDANKMPLQYMSSFFDEAMVSGERNAIDALGRAGLAMNTDYTFDFAMPDEGVSDPLSYSRMRGWALENGQLPAEPSNGQPLRSTFTADSVWLANRQVAGATLSDGGSMSWNVIAPDSSLSAFRLETTGTGTVTVLVDDHAVAVSGPAGQVLTNDTGLFITKGLHNLRLKASGGTATLLSLSVTAPAQPPGLTGLSVSAGNGELYPRWPAVPGATGYNVYIKARLDSAWTLATPSPLTTLETAITGLTNDTTYAVVVTYLLNGAESAYSNQVSIAPGENPALLTWEFDDSTKTSGLVPPQTRSLNLRNTISLVHGPWRTFSTNGVYNVDAVGFATLSGIPSPDTLHPDHYIGFSIQPIPGKTLRLEELMLGLYKSSSTDPIRAEIRVSTDGFATYSVAPFTPDTATLPRSNGTAASGRPILADLRGIPALRSISDSSVVEFRIHLWGTDLGYWGLGKLGDSTDDLVLRGYPIDPSAADTPSASLPAGLYTAPLSVTLSTLTPGARIRYTTDGSEPSATHGTLIDATSGTVVLTASTSLRAVAFADGMATSLVLSRTYTIAPRVHPPVFSPAPGVYSSPLSVRLSSLTSGASFRYTTDGSDPSSLLGIPYTGEIPVSAGVTLRAIAYKTGMVDSEIAAGPYSFDLNAPGEIVLSAATASVNEAAGSLAVTVRRVNGFNGPASVAYATANGTATAGQDYTAITGTLNWADQEAGDKTLLIPILNDADVEANETFTLTLSNPTGAALGTPAQQTVTLVSDDTQLPAAAPAFSPVGGTYSGPVTVAIASATPGAVIRYTVDGSAPTSTTGLLYTGPFEVAATTTVRAIAGASGLAWSAATQSDYNILPAAAVGTFLQTGTDDIVMEAENFLSQTANGDATPWTVAATRAGYQGTGHLTTADVGYSSPGWGSGARVSFPVRFSAEGAGTYYLWSRVYAPNNGGNSFYVGVDGTVLGSFTNVSTGAWRWIRQSTALSATANGLRNIHFEKREDGLQVDKIVLTRNTSTSYLGTTSAPAESSRALEPAAAPVSLPFPGVHVGSVDVSLVSAEAGASIRYTTDGSTPTSTTGTLYTAPFTLSSSATVKTLAYKTGLADSVVLSFAYSIEAGSLLALSADTASADEDAGSLSLQVLRQGSLLGAVSVQYSTADGTATAGQDYSAVSGTLSWADGDASPRTLSIPILDDSVFYEGEETFTLTLSSPVGASLGSPSQATLTVVDDDTNMPPVVTRLSPASATPSLRLNETLVLDYTVTDDGFTDPLASSWEQVTGPGTALFDNPNAASTSVTFDAPGSYELLLSAYDGENTTPSSLSVTVLANQPPVLANPLADQTLLTDSPLALTLPADTFADPEGEPLTLAATLADASPLPAWLSFNPATRSFSGTPSAPTRIDIRVTATDPGGLSASDTFTLAIHGADDLIVLNENDSGPGSLRQTVLDAPSGQTLGFAPGVNHIVLTSGEILIDKTLTLVGYGTVTLSGNNASRIFNTTQPLTLRGLTLTQGNATEGGAVLIGSTFLAEDCVFSGNAATAAPGNSGGGALRFGNAAVTLRRSTFSGNSSTSRGGALYMHNSSQPVLIEDCAFTSNTSASSGAALSVFFSPNSSLLLRDSSFTGNAAGGSGGGLHLDRIPSTLERCVISGNTAGQDGGGLLLENAGENLLTDCIIANNTISAGSTARYGAGTAIRNTGNATLLRVTVSGNQNLTTGGDGGGISFTGSGDLNLLDSTISGNSALDDGAGLLMNNAYGFLAVRNCTVTANSGDRGDGIWIQAGKAELLNTIVHGNGNEDLYGTLHRVERSLYGSSGATITTAVANLAGQDPLLGPLADNGGLTPTHLPAANSPVLDAGPAAPAATLNDRYTQLVGLSAITGIVPGSNTDPDGHLYANIVDTTGAATTYRVDLFKDSARTQLVAHSAPFTRNTGEQTLALSSDNASGLGGTLSVNSTVTPTLEYMQVTGIGDLQNITGANAANTDANGMVWITTTKSADDLTLKADFYKSSAKAPGDLVAHTDYTANGQAAALIADNASGLGGSVTITRTNFSSTGYAKLTPASNDIRIRIGAQDQRGLSRLSGTALDIGAVEVQGDTPAPYSVWVGTHTWPGGADSSATGNPDNDAYNNLAEYAMDLDPLADDGAVLQQHSEPDGNGGWRLVMSVPHNPAATDVVWELLRASAIPATLDGWTVDAGEVTVDYPAGRIQFTLPVPSSQTQAFLGLRLRLP